MGRMQRGVGLQASAAGAVGGGAQQSIGLALEPPALGCARSEVIDHQERVLGDERQALIEIRRARPRARQTMGGEPGPEVSVRCAILKVDRRRLDHVPSVADVEPQILRENDLVAG